MREWPPGRLSGPVATELGDYEAYVRRIGLEGRPGFAALHRAHATTIPFENLDPAAGLPVSLDPAELEAKLVTRRRGGYCFEQNLLFAGALASAGIRDVALLLARVRQGRATGPRPRTHLVLRVVADGRIWHADVGFGGDCLLEPIPFGPGVEVDQGGWRYRTVEDGAEVVLQIRRDGGWTDLYGFVPEPVERVDVEMANWYVSTYPRSPFVTGMVVGAQRPGERRMLRASREGEGELVTRTPSSSATRSVSRPELAGVMAEEFGLAGVPLPS